MTTGRDVLRARLRMTVHRGGVGNRPNRLSETHLIGGSASGTIKSGSIMVLNSAGGALKWKAPTSASTSGDIAGRYFFAKDDDNQHDVLATGRMEGLDCLGSYQLSTAMYTGAGFTNGAKLMPDLSNPGYITKWVGGSNFWVVGVVALDLAAPVNLGFSYTPVGDTNSGSGDPQGGDVTDGVLGGTYVVGRDNSATHLWVLRFNTVEPYQL